MNANDVIESYVADVARKLPRKQRNDVAFELRALINEGLQDRAEAAGRVVDADMALEFVRGLGRPEDVAARYRPATTIVDPADGHRFMRLAVIGVIVIAVLGLLGMRDPFESGIAFLRELSRWWGSFLGVSLQWLGLLVVGFGSAAWSRRRRQPANDWKPRDADHLGGGRVAATFGVIGIIIGALLLVYPTWILDFFWGGRAAPQAYTALTYTDTFLGRQAPLLLLGILLNLPLMLAAIASGRWSPTLRRLQTALGWFGCVVMAWTILDGPVFLSPAADQATKLALGLIIFFTLLGHGIAMYRRVTPRPLAG